MSLINCFLLFLLNLILTWSAKCIISTSAANQATTLAINDTKYFVPVVTISTQVNTKLLQNLKTGLKRTFKRNKYQSKTTTLNTPNQYQYYLIDPSFQGVMLVLAFNAFDNRIGHSKYYLPTEKEEDYKVMIDGKVFGSTN